MITSPYKNGKIYYWTTRFHSNLNTYGSCGTYISTKLIGFDFNMECCDLRSMVAYKSPLRFFYKLRFFLNILVDKKWY